MSEENVAVVKRYYEEVFNLGREDVLDEIISPDYMDYGHNPPGKGIEGAKADFHSAEGIFSDAHFAIDDLITSGDQVVVRWTGTLKHIGEFMGVPGTGKQVTLNGISLYRVANGKILETRNSVAWLGLLEQIGALPGSKS